MNDYPKGIESHKALVEPLEINVRFSNKIAYAEPGFSLDVPMKKRKQIERTFLKACGITKKEQRLIKRFLRGDKVDKEQISKLLKRIKNPI